MQTFRNKKVAVVGLSVEGLDSTTFFAREGAEVTCCDRRTKEELGDIYARLVRQGVTFQLGDSYLSGLERFDLIVRTPGISPREPQFAPYRDILTSQTKLFFDLCAAPIIGVTGTKGKGTTSSLIAQMIKNSGKAVYLGGNVGMPLLSKVRHIKPGDSVVLELSSFQLEDLKKSPHVAVVLPITQDHLVNTDPLATNFHERREDYVFAKSTITRFQTKDDVVIANADNETSASFAKASRAKKYFVSRSKKSDSYVENHSVFVRWEGNLVKICDWRDVILRGDHNLENIAAATLSALTVGCSFDAIRASARSFAGLPHRLQLVGEYRGISYYDDSFSTVPETTIAALQSFDEPIVLIAGGSEKGSDFTELGRVIAGSKVKALIAIGQMTSRIVEAAKKAGFNREIVMGLPTMHDMVMAAHKLSKPGYVVLLSPACASFDMFKNYKERGDQFAHEVSLLSHQAAG